jgi:hypothetical protein
MPSKATQQKPVAALPSIPKELIDQMVSGPMDAEVVNATSMAFKTIYTAPSAEAALAELDIFAAGPWGEKFPTVAATWRRAWDRVFLRISRHRDR